MVNWNWRLHSFEPREIEPAGINSHAESDVHIHLQERVYFFVTGDPARGRDLELRGRAQAFEPFEVGALQHSLFIDVGAKQPPQ